MENDNNVFIMEKENKSVLNNGAIKSKVSLNKISSLLLILSVYTFIISIINNVSFIFIKIYLNEYKQLINNSNNLNYYFYGLSLILFVPLIFIILNYRKNIKLNNEVQGVNFIDIFLFAFTINAIILPLLSFMGVLSSPGSGFVITTFCIYLCGLLTEKNIIKWSALIYIVVYITATLVFSFLSTLLKSNIPINEIGYNYIEFTNIKKIFFTIFTPMGYLAAGLLLKHGLKKSS